MSTEPSTESTFEHQLGKQIMDASQQVNDQQGLLDYLEMVSSASSALHYGLLNATWRGQLCTDTPPTDRPATLKVLDQLTRAEGVSHPGEATFRRCLHGTMTAAKVVADLASTAWSAGLTEVTREKVDEAHAERAKQNREETLELFQGVMRAVKATVPDHLLGEVEAAVRKQIEEVKQKKATPAP
ncbi:hypothetical protein [Streptomyces sp. NPDC048516]|uniref:hypothetical protein n=1 Tax=Streptomyces sp. NPDC048516 TaxID=3365565 RepID=UPI003719F166